MRDLMRRSGDRIFVTVDKSSALYRKVFDLFERPAVFNAYQTVVDGGKGRQIRRFLQSVQFESVIDIGCGTGNWAELVDVPYLGIDSSPSFIAGCTRRFAGDTTKRFVQADAADLEIVEQFDLAMLISVLHHLSDAEVDRLLSWLSGCAKQFFVLDLYPVNRNPLSRWLYRMDRGDFVRERDEQRQLLERGGHFSVVKEDDYYCPNGLYRHTLFLLRREARSPG